MLVLYAKRNRTRITMTTNLYQIGQWAKDQGLVGEREIFLTGAIIAVSGKPIGFGIEAPAGSGKTVVADLLFGDKDADGRQGLIKRDYIYFKDAGSATSFFYDADRINAARIVVFMELQKDKTDTTVEAIKSMTEGKFASRRVTDVTKDAVKEQKIRPKTVAYTLAIENDTKPDAELRRRCITMATDVSKEQTGKVLDLKAALRFDYEASAILTDAERKSIYDDFNAILVTDFKVVNPFAQEFVKAVAKIAPDQKVRSMAEHFWNVMEGVTKLNYLEGRVAVGKDGRTLISNIQDLYQTLAIYKRAFIRDVYSIPPLGDIILKGFDDALNVEASKKDDVVGDLSKFGLTGEGGSRWIDVNHLRKAIKEKQKVVLAKNVVIQICRQLVDAGYLEDWKDGTTMKYQIQERLRDFDEPDKNKLIECASNLVKEKYPEKHEKWLQLQSQSYQDPITGEWK